MRFITYAKAGSLAALLGATALPATAAEFNFAGPTDAFTLDPHAVSMTLVFALMQNVYEPLVKRGADLSLQPGLATEWKNIEPKVWEFKLREGVTFSNGNAFTADDVIFSIERARGGGTRALVASIEKAEKVDDYTVRLHTRAVNAILPSELSIFYILDKEWAEANGALETAASGAGATENFAARNAMGTGPYVISARDPGVKIEFTRSDSWWDQPRGNIDKATYHIISNPATRVAALLTGEVDMIEAVPPQDAERIEKAEGVHLDSVADLRTVFVMMDVDRDVLLHAADAKGNPLKENPLKDKRVREAMRLAIDTAALKARVMRGYSTPVSLPIGMEVTGATPELAAPHTADLDRALALMAEAGYGDGFQITIDCPNDRFMNDEASCIAIGSFLARINIKVTPRAVSIGKWSEQVSPPGYNTSMALLSNSPYTYDGYQMLTTYAATRDPEKGLGAYNLGGFTSPELDDLIAKIGAETDPPTRTTLMQQAFAVLKASDAYLSLHQLQSLWGVKDSVEVVHLPDQAYPLDLFTVK